MAKKKVYEINMRLVRDDAQIPQSKNGNWYDCYCSGLSVQTLTNHPLDWQLGKEEMKQGGFIKVKPGDTLIAFLGFATDLGVGHEGHLIPRSSTYPKYGLLLSNGMGLIDDSYNGDGDEWRAVFHCTREAIIPVSERLVQMQVVESSQVEIKLVESLGNDDRGGYGSTDK